MIRLFRIKGVPQFYSWGSPARASLVATLGGLVGAGGISDETPCAELWYGAHPKAPSPLGDQSQRTLLDVLHPAGPGSSASESSDLLFLLKVLSVHSALSIQAHPGQELAVKLHQLDPRNYPDQNHKPEVGIALSPVRLLYGFRPAQEMSEFIAEFPRFRSHLPGVGIETSKELAVPDSMFIEQTIRRCYDLEPAQVQSITHEMRTHITARQSQDPAHQLFMRLRVDFPADDVGLLIAPLLNIVELQRFEAVFIEPCVPHAYLSGNLIECMANSDNVVRAGLTKKHQDKETLLSMLAFSSQRPEILRPTESRLKGEVSDQDSSGISWYERRCSEFQIGLIQRHGTFRAARSLIVLSVEGRAEISCSGERLTLNPGEAIYYRSGDGLPVELLQIDVHEGLAVLAF